MIIFKTKLFFIRSFYRFFNPVRRFYWKVTKAKTFGTKMLLKHDNKFLMVRNSYGPGYWTPPGGRLKRNEDPKVGAVREAWEETGIVAHDPVLIGQYVNLREGRTDTVFCYFQEVFAPDFKLCPYEIAEGHWFLADEFPDFQSHAVAKVMAMYQNQSSLT